MRITLLAILASISFLSLKAQTRFPVGDLGYAPWLFSPGYHSFSDTGHSDHKWHLSKYASLSAGYMFFGSGASYLSAPVGLQLSRPLNKNLYAFAGVSATPVFLSYNRLPADARYFSSYPGISHAYGVGLNPRVEAGLMYINDAKTFSISGSIGVERSSYPVYPVNGNGVNTKKP